jgi:hypothetical protein
VCGITEVSSQKKNHNDKIGDDDNNIKLGGILRNHFFINGQSIILYWNRPTLENVTCTPNSTPRNRTRPIKSDEAIDIVRIRNVSMRDLILLSIILKNNYLIFKEPQPSFQLT